MTTRPGDPCSAPAAELERSLRDHRDGGRAGPGNAVLVEMESEQASEICSAFGETGVVAEAVADRVTHEARRYLAAGVPVGAHLADQLMPLLALGSGSAYRTLALTQHAKTNAAIVRMFTGATIDVTPEGRDVVRVDVKR